MSKPNPSFQVFYRQEGASSTSCRGGDLARTQRGIWLYLGKGGKEYNNYKVKHVWLMADPHGQSEKGLLDPNNETCFTFFLFFVFPCLSFSIRLKALLLNCH